MRVFTKVDIVSKPSSAPSAPFASDQTTNKHNDLHADDTADGADDTFRSADDTATSHRPQANNDNKGLSFGADDADGNFHPYSNVRILFLNSAN